MVLIDGHPQYQGIFGHPLPDAYVASDVEKVEIIRGPASILYGSNAMAGVINMITKKQTAEGLMSSWGASFGSYNTQKFYGTLGYKKDKWNVFVSANHDQTDGIRANTDFNISNGYSKVGYEMNKHFNLNADFNIAQYNANDNGPIQNPALFNIDITRGKAALSLDNKFENADGSFKIYHNFGEHILSDGFQSTDRNSGLMLFETFRFFGSNSITVGADFKQYGGTANRGLAANQLKTVNELALYAYTQQLLFKKMTLSAGLRLENNSVYGNELIPLLGLSYVCNSNTYFQSLGFERFPQPDYYGNVFVCSQCRFIAGTYDELRNQLVAIGSGKQTAIGTYRFCGEWRKSDSDCSSGYNASKRRHFQQQRNRIFREISYQQKFNDTRELQFC